MYTPRSERDKLYFGPLPIDEDEKIPFFAGFSFFLKRPYRFAKEKFANVDNRKAVLALGVVSLTVVGLWNEVTPSKGASVTPLCDVTTPDTIVHTAIPADFAAAPNSPETEILTYIPGVIAGNGSGPGTCVKTAGILAFQMNGSKIENPAVGDTFILPGGLAPHEDHSNG